MFKFLNSTLNKIQTKKYCHPLFVQSAVIVEMDGASLKSKNQFRLLQLNVMEVPFSGAPKFKQK